MVCTIDYSCFVEEKNYKKLRWMSIDMYVSILNTARVSVVVHTRSVNHDSLGCKIQIVLQVGCALQSFCLISKHWPKWLFVSLYNDQLDYRG